MLAWCIDEELPLCSQVWFAFVKSTVPEVQGRPCKDLSGLEEASAMNVGCFNVKPPNSKLGSHILDRPKQPSQLCLSHFHLPSMIWVLSSPFPELEGAAGQRVGTPDED